MDITSILGLNNYSELEKPSAEIASEPTDDVVNIEKGVKTDALSAVKLDPAVLEAQITFDTALNMPGNRSEDSFHEEAMEEESSPVNLNFDETLISLQKNAMLNLTSQQCDLLLIYVNNLRKQRNNFQKHRECAFCKGSGQSAIYHTSHSLRDGNGRIQCPILRSVICPRCGETGDRAHTPKYCPNIKRRIAE